MGNIILILRVWAANYVCDLDVREESITQGLVVQSIVSLTKSLVNYSLSLLVRL